jgi:Tol biopolymer transport system component
MIFRRSLLALFSLLSLFILPALLVCLPVTGFAEGETTPELTVEYIMRDSKWIGSSPSNVHWSIDGKAVYFEWNPDGEPENAMYTVDRNGGEPRRLTDDERHALPPQAGDYNRQRTQKVYERNGDLFLLDIKANQLRQLTNTIETESKPCFTSHDTKICYERGNNLYLFDIASGDLEQITNFMDGRAKSEKGKKKTSPQQAWIKQEEQQLFEVLRKQQETKDRRSEKKKAGRPDRPVQIYLDGADLNRVKLGPDSRYVTFRLDTDASDDARTTVPNFITASGYTETIESRTKVGGASGTSRFGIYDRERDTVYYVDPNSIPGIGDQPEFLADYESGQNESSEPEPRPVRVYGPIWSDDASRAVVEIRSLDSKDRWLMLLDPMTGALSLLDRQHDEAWIGGPGVGSWYWAGKINWLADNRTLVFQSEASGYSHLYAIDVVTKERRQLTRGKFELSDVTLSHDKKLFYFTSNEVNPGERHFYRLPVSGGTPEQITSLPGGVKVYLSPD